jgi:hypothetical protein
MRRNKRNNNRLPVKFTRRFVRLDYRLVLWIEDRNMKRYEPSTPGFALALTAAAMAAITMVIFVVLPAELDSLAWEADRPAQLDAADVSRGLADA